ncbi:MAG: energy-coupled thiamine transporter ThiT [Christensenellaceae bacterium]|nr:energy-coupled thiamine transporter ThiT [Christensenellaceae bacterium]
MLNTLLESKFTLYLFKLDTPHNIVRTVCIWLTLAMIIAFVVTFFTIKKDKQSLVAKIGLLTAIIYAAIVGITFLVFTFVENNEEGAFIKDLFYPLLVAIIVIAASVITLSFVHTKPAKIIAGVASAASIIVVLVFMAIRFANAGDDSVKSVGLYVSSILAIAAVVAVAFIFDPSKATGFPTKSISYAAICIALSFALSYLRIVKMPQGGSITIASLLPLMIYAYMFGTKKGIFAGAIYGLLQAIQDPYIVHPAQFLLDYPIAFACIGLCGLFANSAIKDDRWKFALGGVVAGLARFVMHFLSGVFAFAAYAPAGQNVIVYSFLYQAGYVLPDIAIAIIVGIFVFSSKSFIKTIKPSAETEKTSNAAE